MSLFGLTKPDPNYYRTSTPPEPPTLVLEPTGNNDQVQINAALAQILSNGGGILVLTPGPYDIAGPIIVTPNPSQPLYLLGFGAKLVLSQPNITALLVNSQGAQGRQLTIEGLVFSGTSGQGQTAIEIRDTNWARLIGIQIENCDTGIVENNATANNFVEGLTLEDIVIRNPIVFGISFVRGAGTNSFGQHNYRNVNINVGTNGVGFNVPSGCSIYRSRMQVGTWGASNTIGFFFDGDFDNVVLDLFFEGASGSVSNTAISIGTNATNTVKWIAHFSFWGTIANKVLNPFNKDFWYQNGRLAIGGSGNTTTPWEVQSDLDTAAKIFLGIGGTAGGRITFGNGTGANDGYIERAAASVLGSNAQFRPASFKSQTKAGAPVDGDITGGAVDGNMVLDTTNSKIWFRTGGVWKGVVIA